MRTLFTFTVFILLVVAAKAQSLPELIPYCENGKWGYVNQKNEIVIPAQWWQAYFFNGDRAYVHLIYDKFPGNIFCIINKKGDYIVPPERRWNGIFDGWENTTMNSCDTNGLCGLIDTNNNELIPRKWQSSPAITWGNLKLVGKNNGQGLINQNNELVVPCKYSSIDYKENIKLKGFIVYDTDTQKKLANALSWEGAKWIDYTTLQERPMPDQKDLSLPYEQKIGEYILSGGMLIDSSRKVLVPCCIELINSDSIVLFTEEDNKNSIITYHTYINFKTLKPYRQSIKTLRYYYQENNSKCGQAHDIYRPQAPYIWYEGSDVYYFLKDSFVWHIDKLITNNPTQDEIPIFSEQIPQGESFAKTTPSEWNNWNKIYSVFDDHKQYGAIVDDQFNYIVLPSRQGYDAYNITDSISLVKSCCLTDKEGRILYKPRFGQTVTGGFRCHGKVYMFTRSVKYKDIRNDSKVPKGREQDYKEKKFETIIHDAVVDTSGMVNDVWSKNTIIQPLPASALPKGEKGFITLDTNGYINILNPAGKKIFPRLCGKYKKMWYVGANYFFVWGRKRSIGGVLLNKKDKDVLPDVNIETITPAVMKIKPYTISKQEVIPQLFLVSGTNRNTHKNENFYFSADGIAYRHNDIKQKDQPLLKAGL